ncbi:PRC-barrel domain-containing protein [Kaistia soli DSM 19436]|uniref:PRC-barrel domain-containing protein n=1 Tax=Kaistia soli DSM 19436 TaxID=1122133 RepID=A0A1M5A010_9HYPH|nr:PRC-barrel domain-containing protein [Kaistia soli]SHF23588.1 PRC-barrel domain-containing protein [Kaistia soli DSM 19436]
MTKLFAATAIAGLLAAAPAFAQDATPAPTTPPAATGDTVTPVTPTAPLDRFVAAPAADDWVASRLIGSTIYGVGDENLGDVNDLIATKDGQVKAVVIGVGGFLGIGEKNVAVNPSALERVADGNSWKYRLNTTKDELTAAPEFKVPDATPAEATGSTAPADPVTPTDPATPMAPAAPSTTAP